jgi:hypothetical protein
MAEYVMNEAMFEVPDGWFDTTTNVVHLPNNDNLVKVFILRSPIAGRTLAQFFESQEKELAKKIPFFTVLSRGERVVEGRQGLTIRASTKERGNDLYHTRVGFAVGPTFVILSTSSLLRGEKEADALLEHAIKTLKFRDVLPG